VRETTGCPMHPSVHRRRRPGKGRTALPAVRSILQVLAGLATGKGTHVITLHLLKAAPKMTRLDEAGLKKRAATRGDVVVEVKPGDAVLGVTDGWMVEQYLSTDSTTDVKTEKRIRTDKAAPVAGKKAIPVKTPTQGELKLGVVSTSKKAPAKGAKATATKAPAKGKPKPAAGSKLKKTPAPAASPKGKKPAGKK